MHSESDATYPERINKLFEIYPNDPVIYYLLGHAYRTEGKIDLALDSFRAAMNQKPHFVHASYNVALIQASRGNYMEAYQIFKEISEYNANEITRGFRTGALYNIAALYAIKDQRTDSLTYLRRAVEEGFADWKRLKNDKKLKNIADSPYYKELVGRIGSS
jgi:tetratricopeptide (TPR) repeat protein